MVGGPVRVLIVDDHKMFADALKLMLNRSDCIEQCRQRAGQ